MQNQSENLAYAIRLLQSGVLPRADFFQQLDRLVATVPGNVPRLFEVLSEEQAKAPLPPEVYSEVQRRIEHLVMARRQLGDEETFVQTRPDQHDIAPARPLPAAGAPGAEPERMKGEGDTLNGRFVLEQCIGFGGMGTVYKALDLRKLEAADRQPYIAIKVLNVQFRGHPKSLVALQREARKAQTLAHPNIVSVYDFDRDGSMVYLTMEYLSGTSLAQKLRAPGFKGMSYAEALPIFRGMGKALAYAHERGFVHCDFKPANVILTDSGAVKVIDFGIARVFQKAEEDVDVTVFDPGSLGALTPAYASPEMLEHREPDPRDDIYALACITYELLTGRHPFDRLPATQARAAGLRPQRPPNLGRRRWRGLKAALAFERTLRTPSVTRFLKDMAEEGHTARTLGLVASGMAIAGFGLLAVMVARHYWPATNTAAPTPTLAQQSVAPVQPAPPVRPAAIAALLEQIPCSALIGTLNGQSLTVQGYLSRNYGSTRLKDRLAALPGIGSVQLEVEAIDDAKCPVITALAPYWLAHRRAGGGAAIRLSTPNAGSVNTLTEGAPLMVDVTTSGAESYVAVDYFTLDGSTAHLLPTALERENHAPAHYTATIGSLGNWVIAKPFGNELVVLLTTPVPLFDSLRPAIEPSADYLHALQKQLAQISARYGAGKIGVSLIQIATRPRTR